MFSQVQGGQEVCQNCLKRSPVASARCSKDCSLCQTLYESFGFVCGFKVLIDRCLPVYFCICRCHVKIFLRSAVVYIFVIKKSTAYQTTLKKTRI